MAEQDARAVRVLLLAREGEARNRLEAALADAGAELLRAVDPASGDPAADRALQPAAVLVALEPAIEDALERYDALLSDPGVLVMFDEAEVAGRREGWDAARWVRHLAAKLNGHADVLPPGTEAEVQVHPEPGALPERAFDPGSVDLVAMVDTAQDLSAEVPRASDFDAASPEAPADPAGEGGGSGGFSGLLAAEDMDWSSGAGEALSLEDDPALAALLAGAPAPADARADAAPGLEDTLSFDVPAGDVAGGADGAGESAAGDAAVPAAPDPLSLGANLSLADDDAPLAVRDTTPAVDLDALEARVGGLSLADDGDAAPIAAPAAASGPAVDLDALSARLDGLSLADPDSYGHGALRGAVVVEAGLGGPDAVRQLLGGLEPGFGRAVLVRLQLDGGRYDRLVQQMQRASALPVKLAEAGATAEPGTVYFLPPALALVDDRARLRFATADAPADGDYSALPPGDSALVFLSGADGGRVDRAMALAQGGALVLAQAPGTCYDAVAVSALVARGAVSAEPGDLAQALTDRWP